MTDPIQEQVNLLAGLFQSDIGFYGEKLVGIVNAYHASVGKRDPQWLLKATIKALDESPNDRQDLCHLLVLAIDHMARTR